MQLNVEYYANSDDNLDLSTSLSLVSELLEREIEKDKYRSYFHSWNNCSLHQHWYTGASSSLVAKQSIKRKKSIKVTVSSADSEKPPKKVSVKTEDEDLPKRTIRRTAVISDSEDSEDLKDDDFSVSTARESESKKHKHTEHAQESKATVRISKSASVKVHPVVSIKLNTSDIKPKAVPTSIASEVVPAAEAAPAPKSRPIGSGDAALNSQLRAIVEELMQSPTYDLFIDPVPRSCADYYQLIETPICFRDILKKTQNCRYKSLSGFRRDFFTLITNCLYYNMLDDVDQTNNRKQAYSLHSAFLRRIAAVDKEASVDAEDLVELSRVMFDIIERVYKVRENNFQLIRYFAVDPKQLPDYDKYVKKPILLRSILVRLPRPTHA